MTGMNRVTGKAMAGLPHILQSIGDILTTPVGSRPMRRNYGAYLHKIIDQPNTPANRLLASSYCASAIARWESRVKLNRVSVTLASAEGKTGIDMHGYRVDLPQPFSAFIPL